MPAPHLGVLVGLKSEAVIVRKYLSVDRKPPHPGPPHKGEGEKLAPPPPCGEGGGGGVTIAISGARKHLAQEAAARLIEGGANNLMSFGYAGGLHPAYRPGTVLIPREIRTSGPRYLVDPDWHRRVLETLQDQTPDTAPLFGSDGIIGSIEEKAHIYRTFGASGVDMESHILGKAAQERGLPFLALRVVLDPADRMIPPAATVSIKPDGSVDGLALFRSIVATPTQLPALIALGRASKIAEKTLLGCSRRCGPLGFGVG